MQTVTEAHLDPWCLVELGTGENVFFGFALSHPQTGGLSWLNSTEVLELDIAAGRARTASGRVYRLGRRFDPVDVSAEGEEARTAFELLLRPEFEEIDTLLELDRSWVSCCKAARFIGITPPLRTRSAVARFMKQHLDTYIELRRTRRP